MLYRILLTINVIFFTATLSFRVYAQEVTQNLTSEPTEAQFVIEDVQNFINAYRLMTVGADTSSILQSEYLQKGTPGLNIFTEKYGLDPRMLQTAIHKHPEKYASLDDLPILIQGLINKSRKAFVKLKEIIPHAVFPPTYFLVEAFRGIGSGSTEGQLISVEKWNRPIENKTTLIIHELVHFQQVIAVGYEKYIELFGPQKSLLGLCIREGTAEFFADLVTGDFTQSEAYDFTLNNENELWVQFKKDMLTSETGDWMWKKPTNPEQPMHVGYVMGYRIVQSYYNNAKNKKEIVREILGVTDYQAFLEQSGYGARFIN